MIPRSFAVAPGVGVALVLALACAVSPPPPREEPPGLQDALPLPAASVTKLVLLGTGTPNPDPNRMGPAVAIVVDDAWYVVDAGPGVVRQFAAARQLDVLADHRAGWFGPVFLTHLHSDHTLGLADAILSPWVEGRDIPLEVYGPPGVARMIHHLEEAYREDVRNRIDGLQPSNLTGYRATPHEIQPGVVYTDARVTVTAFGVHHGDWEHAFGYRFETPDRVIVVSGDLRPSESLVAAAAGADLLVHEVYSHAAFQRRSEPWQKYHANAHTSTLELGEIAARTRPGLLVLYHQLFWGASEEDLLAEIETIYDGPVVSGKDLDVY